VRNSAVDAEAPFALSASDVRVRTTPFTCGCHASVANEKRASTPPRDDRCRARPGVVSKMCSRPLRLVSACEMSLRVAAFEIDCDDNDQFVSQSCGRALARVNAVSVGVTILLQRWCHGGRGESVRNAVIPTRARMRLARDRSGGSSAAIPGTLSESSSACSLMVAALLRVVPLAARCRSRKGSVAALGATPPKSRARCGTAGCGELRHAPRSMTSSRCATIGQTHVPIASPPSRAFCRLHHRAQRRPPRSLPPALVRFRRLRQMESRTGRRREDRIHHGLTFLAR